MIRKLLKYAKKYSVYALLSPLCIAVEVLMEVAIPFLMSIIVDCGINGKAVADIGNPLSNLLIRLGLAQSVGTDLVIEIGMLMVLMAILSLIMGSLAATFSSKAGMGFGAELRKAMFERIQNFSFANIDKFSTASLVTRMTNDVNMIQMGFMALVRICMRAPLMLVCAMSFAFSINKSLSLIFLIVTPLLFVILLLLGSKAHPRFIKMFKKYDKFNASIQENLIAIRVVKSFVRAKHEKEKFEASNDDLRDTSVFAQKLMIMLNPLMSVAMYSCIVVVLMLAGKQIVAGSMGTGELMSFISYIVQILMSLMMIAMIFIMYVMAKAAMTRVLEVLNEEPSINDDASDPSLSVRDGGIEFKNVSFKYSEDAEKNVLDSINLSIKPGEIIGIIGGTGSAKTTLVQLIPRLYDVSGGELLVGSHNVKNYTIENLRNAVSMVLQNNVLFSGTIEENLRWGNENTTDDELQAAAQVAQAAGFVEGFPEQYKTWIEQGGVNVSGGQKQRLCIARALLKKPKILILDDSTSAVDAATDAKIREGFRASLGETTTLIIAQRINSVQHADRIIVLEDGKINGIGSHDELMSANKIYREVYESQQEGSVA